MKKVRLGNSNLEVSALCMGSDVMGSRIAAADCFALLDLFRESGGTFLDTGNSYAAWLAGFQGGGLEADGRTDGVAGFSGQSAYRTGLDPVM